MSHSETHSGSDPSSALQGKRALQRALLRERLVAVARPVLAYWVFLLLMFSAFAMAVMVSSPGLDSLLAVGVFGGITLVGVLFGQIMALLRLRDWILLVLWAVFWVVGMVVGAFATSLTGTLGVLVFAVVVLFPIFALGGAWSLRAGRSLAGAWLPLMYASSCALVIAEKSGQVSKWKAGHKWAVWDGFSISVLGVGILLFVVYLAAREGHRLALWRRGPTAPLMGSVVESGAARPRLSCAGWGLVVAISLVLTVGAALMAPYLWRTGPGDEGGGGERGDQAQSQQDVGIEPGDPQQGSAGAAGSEGDRSRRQGASPLQRRWQQAAGDAVKEAREELQPQVTQGLDLLATVLTVLVLGALLLVVFYRPLSRLLLVRHLQRPFVDLPPTTRIRNGWRLVEIALADAGLQPRHNEAAVGLVARAQTTLSSLSAGAVDVHGLAEAAELRDRVEYGLGVHPEDQVLMERASRWTYHTIWDRLGEWKRVRLLYRGL